MTVYRAIKYSQTNPGDWIVLPGAGGGLGHLGKPTSFNHSTRCLTWAAKLFNTPKSAVFVSSPLVLSRISFQALEANKHPDSGEEKKKLCQKLGAEAWIDFKESKDLVAAIKAVTNGFGAHAAVVTAATVCLLAQSVYHSY